MRIRIYAHPPTHPPTHAHAHADVHANVHAHPPAHTAQTSRIMCNTKITPTMQHTAQATAYKTTTHAYTISQNLYATYDAHFARFTAHVRNITTQHVCFSSQTHRQQHLQLPRQAAPSRERRARPAEQAQRNQSVWGCSAVTNLEDPSSMTLVNSAGRRRQHKR